LMRLAAATLSIRALSSQPSVVSFTRRLGGEPIAES